MGLLGAYALSRELGVAIACVDTRNISAGFSVYYAKPYGTSTILRDAIDLQYFTKPVLRIATNGTKFFSIISHPEPESGALRYEFDASLLLRTQHQPMLLSFETMLFLIEHGLDNLINGAIIKDIRICDSLGYIQKKGEPARPDPKPYYNIEIKFTERSPESGSKSELKSTCLIRVEDIIKYFGLYLDNRWSFAYLNEAFPHLFDNEIKRRRELHAEQNYLNRKFDFAKKFEKQFPKERVLKVELGDSCVQTSPCYHDVTFHLRDSSDPAEIITATRHLNTRGIAEIYPEFLEPYDFMHVYDYIDQATRDYLMPSKMVEFIDTFEPLFVHVNRLENVKSDNGFEMTPCRDICDISIVMQNGKVKKLGFKDAELIAKYFSPYLDEESFNDPDINKYVTAQQRDLYLANQAKFKEFWFNRLKSIYGVRAATKLMNRSKKVEQDSYSDFMLAILDNDIEQASKLLDRGIELEARSYIESTPIMFAAQAGELDLVAELIDSGCDLNAKNIYGYGVLAYAVESNNIAVVRLLMANNIQPDIREINVALMFAARNKNLQMLNLLFKNYIALAGTEKEILNSISPEVMLKTHCEWIAQSYLEIARTPQLLSSNSIEDLDFGSQQEHIVLFLTRALRKYANTTSLKTMQFRTSEEKLEIDENLIYFLMNNASLEHLKFPYHSKMDSETIASIFAAIAENSRMNLQSLLLYSNKLEARGAQKLSYLLSKQTNLRKLQLSDCKIGEFATKSILDTLNANSTSLTELDLTYNKIGVAGSLAVANLLYNKSLPLKSLSIKENHNMQDGIIAILYAVAENDSLTKFNSSCCFINKVTGIEKSIVNMINRTSSLESLNLGSNNFSDRQGAIILQAICNNATIKHLSLRGSGSGKAPRLGDESAKALVEVLQTNNTLESIDIWDQNILKGDNRSMILAALENNYVVTSIDGLGLTGEGCEFSQILERNRRLKAATAATAAEADAPVNATMDCSL